MYYEFENIIDIDVVWDKYHIQRYFNSDLTITSNDEKLIFNTRNCIQTIFIWCVKYPTIVCLSPTYVEQIKFCNTWFATIMENCSAIIHKTTCFVSQSNPDTILDGQGHIVSTYKYINGTYELGVDESGISCSSKNKLLLESNFDRMFICNSGILYLKNKQWLHFTFDQTPSNSITLNFDQIGSNGLYSAIDPVSGSRIMFSDIRNQSQAEFGYLGESWANLDSQMTLGSKIYRHENGHTSIFQPLTVNNRMHLVKHAKDHICFIYWLIKQQIFSKYEMCYYLPKCLVDKYLLEFNKP